MNIDDDTPVHCASCNWTGKSQTLETIKDITERLSPGSAVPAGQCPECGALAYLTPLKKPVCKFCGLSDVTRDALVRWEIGKQEWVIASILDSADCNYCSGSAKLDWVAA